MTAVTTYEITDIQKEVIWDRFLVDMPASDFHRLMRHELVLHDKWLAGDISLQDILTALGDPEGLFALLS